MSVSNKQKDYDKMPYKLYEIITVPIMDLESKKVVAKSKKFQITGKTLYYEVVGGGEEGYTKLLQVLGADAMPVFSVDLEHVHTCEVIGEEDTVEKTSPADLKVIHNGAK